MKFQNTLTARLKLDFTVKLKLNSNGYILTLQRLKTVGFLAQVGKMHILLIEDDYSFATFIEKVLHCSRHTVKKVRTLTDGLACLAGGAFDLTLLDLTLPDSSPVNTMDTAKLILTCSPIIILTGNNDLTLIEKAHLSGIEWINKGYSSNLSDLLISTINRTVKSHTRSSCEMVKLLSGIDIKIENENGR